MIFYLEFIQRNGEEAVCETFNNPHDAIARGFRLADAVLRSVNMPEIDLLTHKHMADFRTLGFSMSIIAQGVEGWETWFKMDDFRAYVERFRRGESIAQFSKRWNTEKHGGRI